MADLSTQPNLPRQAVLLIHGIGEQRPHATLRSFVRDKGGRDPHGIVPATAAVYGAPDHISGRLDTRKLKVSWDQRGAADHLGIGDLAKKGGTRTDFYECYWASGFRDTSWRHVRSWLLPIVLQGRKKVLSPRFRGRDAPVRRLFHSLFLCAAALLVVLGALDELPGWVVPASIGGLLVAIVLSSWLGIVTLVRSIAVAGVAASAGVAIAWPDAAPDGLFRVAGFAVVPVVTAALTGFFVRGLGDAARYFDDRPDNVNEIEAVRRTALKMIEALHEERDLATNRFRYDRLIVVGHSLGSVIAYDAVRHAWSQKNRSLLFPALEASGPVSEVVRSVEETAARLPAKDATGSGSGLSDERNEYRSAQQALHRLLRDGGPDLSREGSDGRWIISDLVTLGSPLAYADVFLAKSREDLDDRIHERLLASCPPRYQETAPGYMRFRTAAKKRSCLHQAAALAPVRWTNMFFPHDFIGGPVGPLFGAGIEDVQLDGGAAWPGWFALSYPHSSYWIAPGRTRAKRNQKGFERCVEELRAIVEPKPVLLIAMKKDQPAPAPADVEVVARILRETCAKGSGEPALTAEVRLLAKNDKEYREFMWVPGPSPVEITRASVHALERWVGDRGTVTVRVPVPE